ncbi:hypothetical protein CTZ27_37065 [Streptomyces griseocarneus]|nr:hypothetical protein CTZ27_37065 [Streptomyces griseocarneus]
MPCHGEHHVMKIYHRLNKTGLVTAVAKELRVPADEVSRVLDATLDMIVRTVVGGGSVSITNFGTWRAKTAPPRTARNPHTGATVKLPGQQVIRFRVSPRMKALVRTADPNSATVRKLPKGTKTQP